MTSEFSIHERNYTVRQLTNKKAPGKNGISNEMISQLRSVARQKLLDIHNQSWKTGTFPTSWKEAINIPIFKKGKDRHSEISYRPISLLSRLGKTMECMVNKRLQHHLEKNGLLSLHSLASGRIGAQRTKWHCLPRYWEWLWAEDEEDTGCLCRPHQGFRQSMEGGPSLQAPKEESLWQHVLMDLELLVPETSKSQAWRTDQLFSENQRSPTRWSHLTHSLHYFHWWHVWPAVLPHPTGAACRWPSVMGQYRASYHHSHQDARSNESHIRLGKRVVGNDQWNQEGGHLLLPVSQERSSSCRSTDKKSTSKTSQHT